MGKKDRQSRKKKERQERLRKDKHFWHYGPGSRDLAGLPEDIDDGGPALPPEALEQVLGEVSSGPSLFGRLWDALRGGKRNSRQAQAQELAYDAMEAESDEAAADLARQALALDPDCTDALCVLAETAGSDDEKFRLLEHAVASGERALGAAYFAANRGDFWLLLETRPYMRARCALANALRDRGRLDEAIRHYEGLLDLCPNDNLGVRYVLPGCYFLTDNVDAVRRLLGQYPGDPSAIFAYCRVLERFLAGDLEGAAQARQEARRVNRFAEPYLIGKKRLPHRLPDYYSPGHETEAIECAVHLAGAWAHYPKALSWLKGAR